MRWLQRRKAQQDFDPYRRAHQQALTDPIMLRKLIFTCPAMFGTYARPWEICDTQSWRLYFRQLGMDAQTRPETHYSLRAHYERLEEVAAEAMFRFFQPNVVMTRDELETAMTAVLSGFKDLDKLNQAAWAQEAAAIDTAGSVESLLADAHRTVSDRALTI